MSLIRDDQIAVEVPYDNTASGLTATDTQAAIDELESSSLAVSNLITGNRIGTLTDGDGTIYQIDETITGLVENTDGTFTYTPEAGAPQIINKADITDNNDGTYTFTNNDGSDVTH